MAHRMDHPLAARALVKDCEKVLYVWDRGAHEAGKVMANEAEEFLHLIAGHPQCDHPAGEHHASCPLSVEYDRARYYSNLKRVDK